MGEASRHSPAFGPGLTSMTDVFLRRIAVGGAINWDEIDVLRRRPGARHIDWTAIDRARSAAEEA